MTSKTLTAVNTPTTEETWKSSVPTLALESPCLLEAIFAVAALHLRATNPTDYNLVRASHSYMASALSQYSSTLSNGVDSSNAEALFVTSALVAFQTSASRHFMQEDGDRTDGSNGYTLPVQWFHAFQGVKAIVLLGWQWLRESERVLPIIKAQPALALELHPETTRFFGSLLEGVDEQLENEDESRRVQTRQAYEHSVAFLNWAHQKPERARILGFPAAVSRRFVELIEQQDPRTLVIISCWFAMTRACDDTWWLRGVAIREVTGLMNYLPREWWPKMEWALRIANTEGVIDEGDWGDCWHSEGTPRADEGFDGDVHSHIDMLVKIAPSMPEGT